MIDRNIGNQEGPPENAVDCEGVNLRRPITMRFARTMA